MTQDYSSEWRKALIERDMAVRAIVEFLEALGDDGRNYDPDDNGDSRTFEVVDFNDVPGGVANRVRPKQFPEFDMLKRVREQLEKKLS
jgi:hypothetical protein